MQPIVILGPTAGGKSELAVALAQHLRGQIINADSMQVYRFLDAGTAKPTPEQRSRAIHHLVDIVEPTQRFTVADWLERAEMLIADLQKQKIRPIIVGGTNLYLKALLEGMFQGPPANPQLRAELEQVPMDQLHRRLRDIDPLAAQRIHINDRKRTIRAIEVFQATGQSISALQTQWSDLDTTPDHDTPTTSTGRSYRHDPVLVGLNWQTDAINRRINARVKQMFFPAAGVESLPDETRRLEQAGLLGPQAREALGYKQVLDHLAGRCSIEDALEQTKILTRRFAKTQRTWLKRYRGVHWLDATDENTPQLTQQAMDAV